MPWSVEHRRKLLRGVRILHEVASVRNIVGSQLLDSLEYLEFAVPYPCEVNVLNAMIARRVTVINPDGPSQEMGERSAANTFSRSMLFACLTASAHIIVPM